MADKVMLGVQDALDFAEFRSFCNGYVAGVAAAMQKAMEAREKQLKPTATKPEPTNAQT